MNQINIDVSIRADFFVLVNSCIMTGFCEAVEYYYDPDKAVDRYMEINQRYPTAAGAAPFCTMHTGTFKG